MGWPSWLLLALLSVAAILALAAWLLRFRYAFEYMFPQLTQGEMVVSFLWWRKVFPLGSASEEDPDGEDRTANRAAASQPSASKSDSDESRMPGGAGMPRSGQNGFVAMPWKERKARLRSRLKSAGLKWVLDMAVWGHLLGFALRSGLRTLRFAGPSMESLHVGSASVLGLGRFAAVWSTVTGMVPFLACPVEYGFVERQFSLRLRISGGCSALGMLTLAFVLFLTLPWRGLAGRFLYCWRHPRLNRWQRKLVSLA